MDIGYFFFSVYELLAVLLSFYLLHYYSGFKQTPLLVSLTTIFHWTLSFSYVCLLSVDYVNHLRRKCIETEDTDCQLYSSFLTNRNTFVIVWNIVYWTNFLFVWIVIPFLQSYYSCGGFTLKQRIHQAIFDNVIFYAVAGTLLIIGVIALFALGMMTLFDS